MKTPFEQHGATIDRVFVIENLQAILAVIHALRPQKTSLIKQTEFETIVYAAKEDAYEEIMRGIAQFIASKTNIKPE